MHRTKEERLHHEQRIKDRVFHYVKDEWRRPEIIDQQLKFSETRKRCSCYMCGNPRKHFKEKTIQERKEEQEDLDFNLNEISNSCLQSH